MFLYAFRNNSFLFFLPLSAVTKAFVLLQTSCWSIRSLMKKDPRKRGETAVVIHSVYNKAIMHLFHIIDAINLFYCGNE